MKANGIWICPKLCGCEINMIADWADEELPLNESNNVISYRHPIPFTLENLKIANVCDEHKFVLSSDIEEDPYRGSHGYIKISDAPTEAEKLYIYLFRYSGQIFSPHSCECKIASWIDRFAEEGSVFHTHPKNTVKCKKHEELFGEEHWVNVLKENMNNTEV